ncbi:phage major capsid protein [Mobiluncus curtisii]|uniref:phage major capsid protein n=1 Tax=Mobiluncus curtisii TaxID=2051 RepID=UPI002432E6E5|nr:phage major capsid protein [Mobiluncus curtisii]
MKTRREQLAELQAKAKEYEARIKAGEELTSEELTSVKTLIDSIDKLDTEIKTADAAVESLSRFAQATDSQPAAENEEGKTEAKTVGGQFLKNMRASGRTVLSKSGPGLVVDFKAATDTQAVGNDYGPWVTDVDKQPVLPWRRQLTIASLMSSRVVQGNSLEYFLMGTMEGAPATVGEGGKKPQVHYSTPTPVTESLREIAAWMAITDDMQEDLYFVAQLIDDDLTHQLMLVEENQLLMGDGAGTNIKGLLNRDGVQAVAATAANFADKLAEAKSAVEKATLGGARADGIVMHPDDYLALLLTKDGNQQYYGGGFFQNAYGNGSFQGNPAVWLLPTVTTPAIPKGTALVGAFKTAKVLRKGGIQRDKGWIDQQFIHDQSTLRLKERVGLMVDRPEAFVKVTITA